SREGALMAGLARLVQALDYDEADHDDEHEPDRTADDQQPAPLFGLPGRGLLGGDPLPGVACPIPCCLAHLSLCLYFCACDCCAGPTPEYAARPMISANRINVRICTPVQYRQIALILNNSAQ